MTTTTAPHAPARGTTLVDPAGRTLYVSTVRNGEVYLRDADRPAERTAHIVALDEWAAFLDAQVADLDEQGVTTDPAARAIIEAAAARLDALPTDDEPAGEPVDTRIGTRTIGRDLYEVTRDGIAAGRVAMVTGARWVGYDLAGTARTEPLDSLAEAIAAVDALGATPDALRGAPIVALTPAGRYAAAVVDGAHVVVDTQHNGHVIGDAHDSARKATGRADHLNRGYAQLMADATPTERLAARYGLPVAEVTATTDEVLDEALRPYGGYVVRDEVRDRTPDTDALDETPRPLDAREVLPAEVRIAVDADCPGCGYPERSYDPARGVFGCSSLRRGGRCGYESTERNA